MATAEATMKAEINAKARIIVRAPAPARAAGKVRTPTARGWISTSLFYAMAIGKRRMGISNR